MTFAERVTRWFASVLSRRVPDSCRPEDVFPSDYRAQLILAHLMALVLTCVVVLSKNKDLLFVGYDGAFYQTTIKLQHEWMSMAPWASHNPFQGLGNSFFCANTRYSLGYTFAVSSDGTKLHRVSSYTIIACEFFLSVLLMGWCLRLRPAVALFGAWILTLLGLPFTFPPLFYWVTALCPHMFEIFAAQCLLIGLFHRVGQHRWQVSVALAAAMAGLGMWCLVFASPCVMLLLPALCLYLVSSLVGSTTREEGWTKASCLVAQLVLMLPTGVPYFAGNFLYSAPAFFGDSLQNSRIDWIWVSVLFHGKGVGPLGPVVFLGSAAGCVLACFSGSRVFRGLGVSTLTAAMIILATGVYVTFFVPNYVGPSPMYFELYLWPCYCLMLGYLLLVISKTPMSWLQRRIWVAPPALARLQLPILLFPAVAIVVSFVSHAQPGFAWWPFPPAETALVRTLHDRLSLCSTGEYRGTTATFTGYSQKPDGASWFDLNHTDSLYVGHSSNDHRAMGLWYFGIPSLFEYNQYMTPSYFMMMTRMLARPQDLQHRSVIVLSKPNPPYLRSLGVRYLITDFVLSEPGAHVCSE